MYHKDNKDIYFFFVLRKVYISRSHASLYFHIVNPRVNGGYLLIFHFLLDPSQMHSSLNDSADFLEFEMSFVPEVCSA